MTNETRNRRFTRKSRQSKPNPGTSTDTPRRSAGIKAHKGSFQPRSPKTKPSKSTSPKSGRGREGGAGWIWGAHSVRAALANPKRTIHSVIGTESALVRLDLPANAPAPKIVLPAVLDRDFGPGHQGVAIKAAPLEWPNLETIISNASTDGLVLVLDQITDPHNVGAMLRLCSAFGAQALVMQSRKAPPLSGATAKVAVGCVETVPVCHVTNIANTLQSLQREGWTVTGLAGETETDLPQALSISGNHVIVMGAEGPGLRPRVRDCCDQLARIPMLSGDVAGEAESLNVATAAAIAMYEVRRTKI